MQHSFRKLLRKNLLYVTFPLVLILSALLLVVFQISRLEMFRTTALSDYTKVGDYYAAEQKNVTITVSNLKSLDGRGEENGRILLPDREWKAAAFCAFRGFGQTVSIESDGKPAAHGAD